MFNEFDDNGEGLLLGKYKVCVRNYSDKSFVFISPSEFGKAFSRYLKEIGGKFNMNLKDENEDSFPGWIFRSTKSNYNLLQELLRDIDSGKVRGNFPTEDLHLKNVSEGVSNITVEEEEEEFDAEDFEAIDVYKQVLKLKSKIEIDDCVHKTVAENEVLTIEVLYGNREKVDEVKIEGSVTHKFITNRHKLIIIQKEK